MQEHIREILAQMGADLEDPSLKDTPERFARVLQELAGRNGEEPPELKTFPVKAVSEMVVVKNIRTATLCPHHCLPYLLVADFGYVPRSSVVGISKPARLLEWCCQRFTMQEEIGPIFIQTFDKFVRPLGSIIRLEGTHLCTVIRGAKQQESTTVTLASSGSFVSDRQLRADFWRLVYGKA